MDERYNVVVSWRHIIVGMVMLENFRYDVLFLLMAMAVSWLVADVVTVDI